MRAIAIIALKEVREALRNRWVAATTMLLAALALTLTFLGSTPTGSVGVEPLDVVIISLSSLSTFLIPLLALLISHDAIVGEIERRTMLLLLSYPVARWQVLIGKFIGHVAILTFATLIGYGAAVIALVLAGHAVRPASMKAFGWLIASSVLMGAAFIAIGYTISALARQRAAAAGIALGVWLVFVILYDMALLGILVADKEGTLAGATLDALLLANPADVFRIFNLSLSAGAGALSGMAGISQNVSLTFPSLLAALVLWTIAPLGLAIWLFARREV